MKDRYVLFKKVEMDGKVVSSSTELTGQVVDEFIDQREKGGVLHNTKYYLIATDDGMIHQARPFNIIKILK